MVASRSRRCSRRRRSWRRRWYRHRVHAQRRECNGRNGCCKCQYTGGEEDRELAQRAFEQRVTKQYLVVAALKEAGFKIEPQDLVPDKRKRR